MRIIFDWESERPDMQLAHDRWEEKKRENQRKEFDKPIPESHFANSAEEGKRLSEIVKDLVRKGGGDYRNQMENIFIDMDLADAVTEAAIEAIIPDGWDEPVADSEQIEATAEVKDWTYEVQVRLFKN